MKKLVLFLMVAMLATTANAANLLTNPSFEADTVADGNTLLAAPTGWMLGIDWSETDHVGTCGVFNPTGDGTGDFDSAVPDGNNVLMCGDPADNPASTGIAGTSADVWQKSIFFPGGVKAGQTIEFSGKNAGLSTGTGYIHHRVYFWWATTTDPCVGGVGNWFLRVGGDRAPDDRDWQELNYTYTVTAEDEAAGYDGISIKLRGFAGKWRPATGQPWEFYDPVFWDDVRLTVELLDPNAPRASNPRPTDGETLVLLDTQLRWDRGISPEYGWAIEHQVYFGTDEAAVEGANTLSPEYMGPVPGEEEPVPTVLTVVQNPSFETDVLADDTWIESEPNGWGDAWLGGINYVWNPWGDGTSDFDSPVPDGNNIVMVGDGATYSGFWQYVPIPGGLQSGQVYTISVKEASLAADLGQHLVGLNVYSSPSSENLWGQNATAFFVRAGDDRDWKEYSVALDVDALGIAGYDGIAPGLETWTGGGAGYDPSCYDDFELSVYDVPPDPTYAPPTLQKGTEYFWRIDEVYDKGGGQTTVGAGKVWSFTTIPPPYCGQPGQYYKPGDINKDCYVDFKDFALMALEWLGCTDPTNPECDPWDGP